MGGNSVQHLAGLYLGHEREHKLGYQSLYVCNFAIGDAKQQFLMINIVPSRNLEAILSISFIHERILYVCYIVLSPLH